MRLFAGISLPEPISESLDQLLTRLRPAARIQWSPVANLHITTKFIGNWPDERLAELSARLSEVDPTGAIPIRIGGLGWFPNPRAPRVLWAGVEAPDSLAALARATDTTLQSLGIPPETKPYSPHLTLARIKSREALVELREAIARFPSQEFGRFEAREFHLYASKVGPGGSVYTRLQAFRL